MITAQTILRIARPTDHLEEVVRFYTQGVGLAKLSSFQDHAGFDGVMLGLVGSPYHLEFTRRRGDTAGRAPTKDNLLVFYLPDKQVWESAIEKMTAAGYQSIAPYNPYWDRDG